MSALSSPDLRARPVRRTQQRGLRSVVAGGLTGGINIMIVFPTEYIKTQLQLDSGKVVLKAHHSRLVPGKMTPLATSLTSSREKVYSGSVDVVRKTLREQGMRGMYRGVQVLLTGTVPTYSVRFGVFDSLKASLGGADGQLSPIKRMLCGLCAGVAEAALVVTWIETLKVRLISDQRRRVPRYRGLAHAATSIARTEGVSGLYKGLGPTVVKQGSNQAIRFFVMESLRSWYTQGRADQSVPYYLVALFGAVAGGASVLGNTPVDVLKTRMQSGAYRTSLECIKYIAKTDGVRGFYKGCLPRLNRVCIEVGLAFCIFDSVQKMFGRVWPG